MKTLITLAILAASSAFALDIPSGGNIYKGATITAVEANGIRIAHENGTAFLVFDALPETLRAKYGPAKKEVEKAAAKQPVILLAPEWAEKYRESEKVREIEMSKKAERDQAEALVKLENERQAKLKTANAAAARAEEETASASRVVAAIAAEEEKDAKESAAKAEKAAQAARQSATQNDRLNADNASASRGIDWDTVAQWVVMAVFAILFWIFVLRPLWRLIFWIEDGLKRGDRATAALIERALAPKPKRTEAPAKYGVVDLAADTAVGAAKFTFKAAVLFVPFAFRTAGKILGRIFK